MKSLRTIPGAAVTAALLVGAFLALAGCSSGLSASSSCEDFMAASPEDQASAISKLATEFDAPDLATPLGSPNVSYTCSSNPDTSLEEVFSRFSEGEG